MKIFYSHHTHTPSSSRAPPRRPSQCQQNHLSNVAHVTNSDENICPLSPGTFQNAAPIVRTVVHVTLIQTSFTASQVFGLEIWKEALELEKPRPSAPNHDHHEYKILYFQVIVELHDMHVRDLRALQLDYARQVVMWGLECSKAEEDWDFGFIVRRKLELVQLNRTTRWKQPGIFEAGAHRYETVA